MEFANTIKQQWGRLDESWRFAISAFLIARLFYAVWSWVILTIQPIAVHYVDVNKQPAVIFLDLYTIEQNTYLRNVNDTELRFRSASRSTVKDLQTGSTWDVLSGLAVEGYFKGTSLTPAPTPIDMFPYYRAKPYPNAWLAMWQRFDVNWYITIAENGYGSITGDDHFPPLYPLLIRLATPLFGNAFIAGLIISNIATLIAIKLLVDFFSSWHPHMQGRNILFYFLIFPTSFFLFSAYTESPFLVVTLLSLRAMQKYDWAWAGFWVFCAILFRLQGVALFAPMFYLMWNDPRFLRKFGHWAGPSIAGMGFLFYIFLRSTQVSGNALPFSEISWHAKLVLPWETYLYAVRTLLYGNSNHIDLLNWATATLFLFLLGFGWRQIPLEYNLYTASNLLIILTRIVEKQPLISMSRYSLTLFPIFFVFAASQNKPIWRRITIYTFLALNLYLSAEFFGWGFVA